MWLTVAKIFIFLVCVDRLTQMVSAEGTACLYLDHVCKHHGLPVNLASDKNTGKPRAAQADWVSPESVYSIPS